MSEMSATVVLSLKDDMSGNARKASRSGEDLLKVLKKLQAVGKVRSAFDFTSGYVRDLKKAQAQARALHSTMSARVPNAYKAAVSGINSVTRAAKSADGAVQALNRSIGRAPSFRGAGAGMGNGGRGRGGHGPGSGGHSGSHWGIGHTVGHAFATAGVFEAVHKGIHYTAESIKGGFEQAFDLQHTKVMLALQGENSNLVEQAHDQALKLTKSLPQFTTAQHMEAIAELRPALIGGLKEAIDLAPMFQKTISILEAVKQGAGKKALGGIETHGEALSLVRALEVKNVTGLGEEAMQNYVDGITKAIVAFNGQIKAEDFHSAFKFSRGDSVTWSKEFSTEILPTLMNELKKSSKTDASQTGNALKSMSRVVMDGIMTPDALAKWQGLGMLENGAFKAGRGGKMAKNGAYHGAALVGGTLWQDNPYKWVQDYLLPHMKEKGIDVGNRKQVVAALGGLFGNRVANHISQILAMQQAIIEKDQDNVRKAYGTGGLGWLMDADPTARMHVLSASFKDLGSSLAELAMPGTMRGMKGTIDWLKEKTDWVRNSPDAKRWGQHFEAAVAGFFRQDPKQDVHSAHWMRRGADKQFYDFGKSLRDWITDIKGGLKKQFDDLGLKEAGDSIKSVNEAIKSVREAFATFERANAAVEKFSNELDAAVFKGVKASLQALQDAFSATSKWFHDKFSWAFPADAVAAKTDVTNAKAVVGSLPGSGGTGLRAARAAQLVPTVSTYDPTKASPFSLSGFKSQMPDVMTPIASAVNASVPAMAQAGNSAMSSFLSGLDAGGSAAASKMATIMGSLSTMAAAGVTIPVNLDANGVEAKLAGIMARASRLDASAPFKPQFSKSLNDTGH